MFDVSARSVHKWLQWYKENGETRLLGNYHRPWNRSDNNIEEMIVGLKEQDPAITIRSIQAKLAEKGIGKSLKGIWGVLQRFGHAGLDKKSTSNYFTQAKAQTSEARIKLEMATRLLKGGKIREAAEILNTVPFLPGNDILAQIPDDLLNVRRRVEKEAEMFGITPLRDYLKKLRALQKELRRTGNNHSALQVGVIELLALEWIYRPVEQLRKVMELKKLVQPTPGGSSYLLFELRYLLLVSEGIAYVELNQHSKARAIARLCKKMLAARRYVSRQPLLDLSALYTYLDEYNKAEELLRKILDRITDPEVRKELIGGYANVLYASGNYQALSKLLRARDFQEEWSIKARIHIFQAMLALVKGEPQRSVEQCMEALKLSRQEELNKQIFNAYLITACAHASMGKVGQARAILRNLLPFLIKRNLRRYVPEIELLLEPSLVEKYANRPARDVQPIIRLILLLVHGAYESAYSQARRKGILSTFIRFTLFFPETVVRRLEKGRPVHLPRAMLMLPAFNRKKCAFHIEFLGKPAVYKNQVRQTADLTPKDTALLIFISAKIGVPGRSVPMDEIYGNFWPKAGKPSRSFSHALVRIKKALGIPTHLLVLMHRDRPVLANRGVFFTNDHQDFEQTLARARAYGRANAWDFARREYIQAFKLWRGEPFQRMYDRWSEDFRTAAMNRYENELDEFIRECERRRDQKTADRMRALTSRSGKNRLSPT